MTKVFQAERREKSGKGPARQLRRESKIPAIVYGGHGEPMRIAMPLKEIKREIGNNPRFFSTVFELDFGTDRLKVLPREAQLHPVSDDPLHVDFLRAEAGENSAARLAAASRFFAGVTPGSYARGAIFQSTDPDAANTRNDPKLEPRLMSFVWAVALSSPKPASRTKPSM